MAFIFTCGTHTFTSLLKGYEHITVQCQNCGNISGRIFKRWEWFTFCFVPIIPFSWGYNHDVGCHICHFYQDVKYRPEVEQMAQQGGGGGGQSIPMQGCPPPGHGYGGQPGYQPPPNNTAGKPQYG